MNRSKHHIPLAAILLLILFSGCKKIIDCIDHNPPPVQTPTCKVISMTEAVPYTITIPPPDTCTVNCEETYIVDTLFPIVKHFYYNSKGDPDSIVFRSYGKDTLLLYQAIKSFYFSYDGQGRLIEKRTYTDYWGKPLRDTSTYIWVDAHTIQEKNKFGVGTIKLDDSMRVISDGDRTYVYDQNGNLELNPWNDNSFSNEELSNLGNDTRLSYALDKPSPRQLSWTFMFIDRDFSKNANELFTNFNSFGYPQRMGGPGHLFPMGYQDVLFGDYANRDFGDTGDRSIQYECTEVPPSKK